EAGKKGKEPVDLGADKVVRQLPAAAERVVAGGGGRYLILHLPSLRQLVVFDATQARIVKYLPLAEDTVHFAAGMDRLFVYLPTANVLQRYNLNTFEKEATLPFPVPGQVSALVMGSASRGPLVAAAPGSKKTGGLYFLDPVTLKEMDYQIGDKGRGLFD